MADFRAAQQQNRTKTWVMLGLMGSVTAIAFYAAAVFMGSSSVGIVPIAVGIALAGVWGSYYGSDKLVLAMTGARVISHDDAPQLFNLVEELTLAAGLPMPKVAIVEDNAPNAFATGRDPEHAVIAFTSGILRSMDREQLQGVAAHELAHVANRDTLVMAVAATTAGAIAILSDMVLRVTFWTGGNRDNNNGGGGNPVAVIAALIALILAPIAALLLKSAVSRKRESLADATAVAFTRNPAGLRKALEVLASDSTVVHQKSNSVAHVWIESPLDNSTTSNLFSTHPPLSERIAILKQMEQGG